MDSAFLIGRKTDDGYAADVALTDAALAGGVVIRLPAAGRRRVLVEKAPDGEHYFAVTDIPEPTPRPEEKAEPKKKGVLLNTEEYGCLPAVEYLKENFAAPFDMDKLQDMCDFSQSHFFRLFKRLTGVSPFTYLKDRRIEEAQKLLLTTSHSVAQIGQQVGWRDQFHFSRIFKARTGCSPRQFREQYRLG